MSIPFAILTAISNFLLKCGIDIRRKLFKSVIDELGGHLRLVIYGAAPMDKSTIKGLKNLGIELLNGYGLTEASPIVSAENDKYQKPGSVAFALPDVEIKIDEPNEQGIGEVIVKGPNIMLGYYDNKEATDEVLIDGWFHTGDLGYYDKDGYLFITGRKKNVIVLKNGKNIYPEELEILIARLPYVAENMVFGRPTDDNDLDINAKIVYNEEYMKQGKLKVEKLGRGMTWFDTGTHDALLETASFVQTIEKRQGLQVCCPEEIAYQKGWITAEQLSNLADKYMKTAYGRYLKDLAESEEIKNNNI